MCVACEDHRQRIGMRPTDNWKAVKGRNGGESEDAGDEFDEDEDFYTLRRYTYLH